MGLDDMMLDATYRAHGRPASYVGPDGVRIDDILFCWHQPLQDIDRAGLEVAGFRLAEHGRMILVRASEVERPESGGAFILESGAEWSVADAIEHDAEGLEWRCRVSPRG
ncbi:hypothetical protein V7S57_02425 [Caulobacter sp. CCNWLY153]|uniref:head-tail joining protein n=1 Tax=unclassified Caulobacter TaxID=2648921 RepID=UPI002FF0FD74